MSHLGRFLIPRGGGVTSSLLVFKIKVKDSGADLRADTISIEIELVITEPLILGVKRQLSSTSAGWTRIDDSVGLVGKAYKFPTVAACETEIANETITDDFAMSVHGGTLPFYKDIDIVNMRVDNGKIIDRLSTNPNGFNWSSKKDNIDVNIMTYYPGHYIKREQKDGWEYIQLSMWGFDGAMYVEPYYRGTFEAIYDNSTFGDTESTRILRSYAGGDVKVSTNIKTFRDWARNNEMSLGDWRDFDFLCLYLIKYANYNSQSQVGDGIVKDSKRATGYSYDGTNTFYAHDTLKGRDGYIGTNQKTSVWCLGLCNPWGNVWEFVDGIYINNRQAYIATDPMLPYNDDGTGYTELGYSNWTSTINGYPRRLGCDSNNPLISFPDTNNSGTGDYLTGTCDYYYQDSGVRVVLRGGYYDSTPSAGAFCFACNDVFSASRNDGGCRLLKTA